MDDDDDLMGKDRDDDARTAISDPFGITNPEGKECIRVTVTFPTRNACMDARRLAGMNFVAHIIHMAVKNVADYPILPQEKRYCQVDIPVDALAAFIFANP